MKDTVTPGFSLAIKNKAVTCPQQVKSNKVFCDEFNECAFFFSFPKEECEVCCDKDKCLVGQGHKIKAGFLSVTGFGAFSRRVFFNGENEEKAKEKKAGQETSIIDSMPCYAGWIYSKIAANGDVIPCCKAHKMPVGNINQQKFLSIWNGKKQQTFRYKGKYAKKSDPYFMPINCYKACDNLGMNLGLHEKINALSPLKKVLLYLAQVYKRVTA